MHVFIFCGLQSKALKEQYSKTPLSIKTTQY